jgi:hypothetical protein
MRCGKQVGPFFFYCAIVFVARNKDANSSPQVSDALNKFATSNPPARQAVPIANRANHLTADHTSGWLRFGASPYQIRGRGQRRGRGRYESPLDGADEDTSEANRAFDL